MKKITKRTDKPSSARKPSSAGKSSTPHKFSSMEELLASGANVKAVGRGDVVKGIILSIGSKEMIVDIGQKSEGMLIGREFDAARPLIEKLAVGQEIEAMVIHPDYEDGSILLSLRKLTSDSQWESLDALLESGKVV